MHLSLYTRARNTRRAANHECGANSCVLRGSLSFLFFLRRTVHKARVVTAQMWSFAVIVTAIVRRNSRANVELLIDTRCSGYPYRTHKFELSLNLSRKMRTTTNKEELLDLRDTYDYVFRSSGRPHRHLPSYKIIKFTLWVILSLLFFWNII